MNMNNGYSIEEIEEIKVNDTLNSEVNEITTSNYEKYYWLNEESRKFLSRGYISETPEQRIKDIANKAEESLKIEGWGKKFEDYMSRGFYTLSTPVWINFGKKKDYLLVVMGLMLMTH